MSSAVTRAALLLALAFPSGVSAQAGKRLFEGAGAPNDSMVFAYLDTLQAAVARGDSGAVARLVHYPMRVNGTSTTWIQNARQFEQKYRSFMTPPVRAKILAQVGDSLFSSWRGIMIGNGEVWLAFSCPESRPKECERLGITAINLPSPDKP